MKSADIIVVIRALLALRAVLRAHKVSLREFERLQDGLAKQGKKVTKKHIAAALKDARKIKIT